MTSPKAAPLSDRIAVGVAKLVDDAMSDTRSPSHSELQFQINRAGLQDADPNQQGNLVGKAKRVRAILTWAIEHDHTQGECFVAALVAHIQACGGFRPSSPDYCGEDAIENARSAFKSEGFDLGSDGDLRPLVLENLSGAALTDALQAYVRRAKPGIGDAALVTGTSKDLLEATAAHVLQQIYGSYSHTANFPTLLGQAFAALNLPTSQTPCQPGEPPQCRVDRALFDLACAINTLRNKQGSGHGRPWLPTVTQSESRIAIESMGIIAERMITALCAKP